MGLPCKYLGLCLKAALESNKAPCPPLLPLLHPERRRSLLIIGTDPCRAIVLHTLLLFLVATVPLVALDLPSLQGHVWSSLTRVVYTWVPIIPPLVTHSPLPPGKLLEGVFVLLSPLELPFSSWYHLFSTPSER